MLLSESCHGVYYTIKPSLTAICGTDFYSSDTVMRVVAYLDASLSIMSIIDGILVMVRSNESWWTWYIYVVVETIVNIISGQWILLVYKLGYFTNTTYGLIRWSKYIKENEALGDEMSV